MPIRVSFSKEYGRISHIHKRCVWLGKAYCISAIVFEQKTYISDIVISNVYAEACRQQSICLRCSSRIFNTVTDEKSATQAEFIASKENDGFDIYHISLSNVL